jgi:hypothetical protein
MAAAASRAVSALLLELGCGREELVACADPEAQFKAIKRGYIAACLRTHPDKGGSNEAFRAVQEAWETVRELHEGGRTPEGGFAHYFTASGAGATAFLRPDAVSGPIPKAEFFEAAFQAGVAFYTVEPARSARSTCGKCKSLIAKGAVRIGSLIEDAGTYGRWVHLECWRVPAAVWLGMPPEGSPAAYFMMALVAQSDLVLLGFASLSAAERQAVVARVIDPGNWAKRTAASRTAGPVWSAPEDARISAEPQDETEAKSEAKPEVKPEAKREAKPKAKRAKPAASVVKAEPGATSVVKAESGAAIGIKAEPGAASAASGGSSSSSSDAIVRASSGKGGPIELPRPGVGGAVASSLSKKTVVLTGVFPEAGGGVGLNQGKERVKAMIESFGGRVTSAVSGNTSYLLIGQAPGGEKVRQATERGVPMVDLRTLIDTLYGRGKLEDAKAPTITSFSRGFGGNGVGAGRYLAALEARKQLADTAPAAREPVKDREPRKAVAAPPTPAATQATTGSLMPALAQEIATTAAPAAKPGKAGKRAKRPCMTPSDKAAGAGAADGEADAEAEAKRARSQLANELALVQTQEATGKESARALRMRRRAT